ncbi:hypothetical protein [Streptomyces mexicanus]|uniref:hypothetical protein n=1 Tax=Streptomyces mexicanus TaxID=178566 RepID=UPI0031EAF48E
MTTHPIARARAARLEALRREYMTKVINGAHRRGRQVRVAPYFLAEPGPARAADLDTIARYARQQEWQVTRSTFADIGQPPPLAQRSGFGAACRYAAQGFAHGILAIARPAITTDDDAYLEILEYLHARGVFLAYLPAEGQPLPDGRSS